MIYGTKSMCCRLISMHCVSNWWDMKRIERRFWLLPRGHFFFFTHLSIETLDNLKYTMLVSIKSTTGIIVMLSEMPFCNKEKQTPDGQTSDAIGWEPDLVQKSSLQFHLSGLSYWMASNSTWVSRWACPSACHCWWGLGKKQKTCIRIPAHIGLNNLAMFNLGTCHGVAEEMPALNQSSVEGRLFQLCADI